MELMLPQTADSIFSAFFSTLKFCPYGVVILDNDGRVFLVSALAKQLIHQDGLTLDAYRLRATAPNDQQKLSALLKEVTKPSPASQTPEEPELLISRPSGKRSYILMFSSLTFPKLSDGIQPAAIVFIHDPVHEIEAPIARMKALFGLTNAESRVAFAIMQGKSLEQCAQGLEHSISTSRNLLKRVFAKTDTNRQNELVSLLLRSPLSIQINQPPLTTVAMPENEWTRYPLPDLKAG